MALAPNNAGAKDVGNGKAQQFTTGGCVADADCRSACCAEIGVGGIGICSAVGAQHQNGKLGCGFVDPNAAVSSVSVSVLYNIANKIPGNHRGCPSPGQEARFQVHGIGRQFHGMVLVIHWGQYGCGSLYKMESLPVAPVTSLNSIWGIFHEFLVSGSDPYLEDRS
jgi:hypothetical protein